jgi:hypothetical protein
METIKQKIAVSLLLVMMLINMTFYLVSKEYNMFLSILGSVSVMCCVVLIVFYTINIIVSIFGYIYCVGLGDKKTIKKYYKNADMYYICGEVWYISPYMLTRIGFLRKAYHIKKYN